MPTNIMLTQAMISTALSLVFVFAESMNAAFIILTELTTQFLLLMYALMFLAAIILKVRGNASATIGGKFGIILLSIIGFGVSVVSYTIGFFPPNEVGIQNSRAYTLCMVIGNAVTILLPRLMGKGGAVHRAS
jgi:hypothetical protein